MRLDGDTNAWELDDAEERHGNAPDLYSLPSLAERTDVRSGGGSNCILFFEAVIAMAFIFKASASGFLFTQYLLPVMLGL